MVEPWARARADGVARVAARGVAGLALMPLLT
jgi:hypothetical protein